MRHLRRLLKNMREGNPREGLTKESVPEIRPVYFVSEGYESYLNLSLQSLLDLDLSVIRRITIVCCCSRPPDLALLPILGKAISVEIEWLMSRNPISWGGVGQIENEIIAFGLIGARMSPESYLAKMDCDLLFMNGKPFYAALNSKADAFGQSLNLHGRVESRKDYFQGGCYFLSAKAISILVVARRECALSYTRSQIGSSIEIPEDAFFTNLLEENGVKVVLGNYYFGDPWLLAARCLSKKDIQRIFINQQNQSVLHFEYCKSNMQIWFEAIAHLR